MSLGSKFSDPVFFSHLLYVFKLTIKMNFWEDKAFRINLVLKNQ
jgi:hypothetical protein